VQQHHRINAARHGQQASSARPAYVDEGAKNGLLY